MSRLSLSLLLALSLAPSWLRGAGAITVAEVVAVQPGRVADVVLLNRGLEAGLREGMVCRVDRGAIEVAEVVLVELRPSWASALILTVSPSQSIRMGDAVSVKVHKS